MKCRSVELISLGGIKCGTTYLYNTLSCEAGFCVSKIKEPCFFSGRRHHGFEWYNGLFEHHGVRCDLSANYIYSDVAIRRISKETTAKLILVARNPFMRALSHINMERRKRNISLNKDRELINDIIMKSNVRDQLERLLVNDLAGRVLIITFDELIGNTSGVIQRLREHVGVKINGSRSFEGAERGVGFTPRSLALEQVRNSATEICLNNFGFHPSNVGILNWANRKYKEYFTYEQEPISDGMQGYIFEKVDGLVNLNEIPQSQYFEAFGADLQK